MVIQYYQSLFMIQILLKLEENDHRLKFISDAIKEMNSKLKSTNNKIFTFKGNHPMLSVSNKAI